MHIKLINYPYPYSVYQIYSYPQRRQSSKPSLIKLTPPIFQIKNKPGEKRVQIHGARKIHRENAQDKGRIRAQHCPADKNGHGRIPVQI